MAKRFTETDKWKNKWFRELPPAMKLFWSYVLDSCDVAGIWMEDYASAAFHIGAPVSVSDVELHFEGRFRRLDASTLQVLGFISFQCGGKLQAACNAHKGVLKKLKERGIDAAPYLEAVPAFDSVQKEPFPNPSVSVPEGFQKGYVTLKDKEQDKDLDKEENKEEIQNKELSALNSQSAGARARPSQVISPVRRVIPGPWRDPEVPKVAPAPRGAYALPQDYQPPSQETLGTLRQLFGEPKPRPEPELEPEVNREDVRAILDAAGIPGPDWASA